MRTVWLSDFDVAGRYVLFELRDGRLFPLEERRLRSDELGRQPCDGRCSEVPGGLHAFFSHSGGNYLAFPQGVIEVTPRIRVECECGIDYEESWLRVFDGDTLLHEARYINPHGPMNWSFPDWDFTNFAFYLREDVEKARQNPGAPVYPSQGQRPR